MIAELTQNQWALVVAIILFATAGLLRLAQAPQKKPWDSVAVAFGLAAFAVAFLLTP